MGFLTKSKTDIKHFLELAETIPVVDVRSPAEFSAGHIPGAYNIPLFNDKEREIVGISYKKDGREKAILGGLQLVGPSLHLKLGQALKISHGGRLLVHCWRGGMRSEAIAWLFSLGGIETEILEGGYKSYRKHILESLSEKRKMIVLGGLTGSGKTRILNYLKDTGHQVIDLEGLANHKGSAFGALGQVSQPSTEQFANLLYNELRKTEPERPVWIEDESRNIGLIFMPDEFYLNIQQNPLIVLLMSPGVRLPGLISDYSKYSPRELEDSIRRITRRLGGDNTREAIEAVRSGDLSKAIGITLAYYDKAYLHGLKSKQGENIFYVRTDTDDIRANAQLVLEASKGIIW